MKCGTKKMGAKKGYMGGGMAKKSMAKKSAKGGMSEMMMKKMGRNMAKKSAKA